MSPLAYAKERSREEEEDPELEENQHEPPVLGLHVVGLHAVLCVSPLIPYLKLHTNHMKHSRSLSTYVSPPLITLIPTSTRLTARRRLQQSPESLTHTTRFAKH